MTPEDMFSEENFKRALARSTDPGTSHAAAAMVDVAAREALVVEELKRRGAHGGTTHEIAAAVDLDRDSISPRMKPLVQKGLIADSGMRRTWNTNRSCIVWVLAIYKAQSTEGNR